MRAYKTREPLASLPSSWGSCLSAFPMSLLPTTDHSTTPKWTFLWANLQNDKGSGHPKLSLRVTRPNCSHSAQLPVQKPSPRGELQLLGRICVRKQRFKRGDPFSLWVQTAPRRKQDDFLRTELNEDSARQNMFSVTGDWGWGGRASKEALFYLIG